GILHEEFPKELSVLERCEPVYEEVAGWKENTSGIKDFEKLPGAAREYIRKIESMLNTRIQIISSGQKRDELIMLQEPF
ncbi:MAG: adenylosuccinate synthetase, partial [Nitrospirae bacterium]|nr:adenylosuccinate synthetase [Nitrospirota bacterium]